jgi:hypothetical protein
MLVFRRMTRDQQQKMLPEDLPWVTKIALMHFGRQSSISPITHYIISARVLLSPPDGILTQVASGLGMVEGSVVRNGWPMPLVGEIGAQKVLAGGRSPNSPRCSGGLRFER